MRSFAVPSTARSASAASPGRVDASQSAPWAWAIEGSAECVADSGWAGFASGWPDWLISERAVRVGLWAHAGRSGVGVAPVQQTRWLTPEWSPGTDETRSERRPTRLKQTHSNLLVKRLNL